MVIKYIIVQGYKYVFLAVMEVATGEHGDWVLELVLAVDKGNCGRGHQTTSSITQPQSSNFNNQQNTKTNNTDKAGAMEIMIGKCPRWV